MAKNWSSDEIHELIEIYEVNVILWDVNDVEYRDRGKRFEIMEEIGFKFGCSGGEIQRKLHNLRNQVSHELKKIQNKQKKSGGDANYFTSPWPYFEALKFVIPGLTSSKKSKLGAMHPNSAANGEVKTTMKLTEKPVNKRCSKRKHETEYPDVAVQAAVQVLAKTRAPDDNDRFGEYVALELRNLRSDLIRRRLKNEIRKALINASEADESNLSINSSKICAERKNIRKYDSQKTLKDVILRENDITCI